MSRKVSIIKCDNCHSYSYVAFDTGYVPYYNGEAFVKCRCCGKRVRLLEKNKVWLDERISYFGDDLIGLEDFEDGYENVISVSLDDVPIVDKGYVENNAIVLEGHERDEERFKFNISLDNFR